MRRILVFIGLSLILAACDLSFLPLSPDQAPAEQEAARPTEMITGEAPAQVFPTETPDRSLAAPTPSLTPLPSPTPLGSEELSAPPISPQLTVGSAPPDTPPLVGSFDVYLGAPGVDGFQLLRWIETTTGVKATEIGIRTDDGYAIRAGQFVYFLAPNTQQPYRVNTAGALEPLLFAQPEPGASFYQFLPSATGNYLAWLNVNGSGTSYTIHLSFYTGDNARVVGAGTLEPGTTIRLVRLTNDGRSIFVSRQPPTVTDQTLFNARYDLYKLDTTTGTELQLPGEPACGENLVCDAHISPDGAFLARTLPPATAGLPVVVTNLVSGSVIARFAPQDIPRGAAYEIGYPFFTPGGELIFFEAYGPPGLERYLLVWGNIVTGEQRLVVDLGSERHRPLGWTSDGLRLLTTREPSLYDTWQIDIRTGEMRQIAGMLFLGYISQPPPANP